MEGSDDSERDGSGGGSGLPGHRQGEGEEGGEEVAEGDHPLPPHLCRRMEGWKRRQEQALTKQKKYFPMIL